MENFLSKEDIKVSKQFESKGYVVAKTKSVKLLNEINTVIFEVLKKYVKKKKLTENDKTLNQIHKFIDKKKLNTIRLKIFDKINKSKKIKKLFFLSAKKYLEILVGNELAMQNRINLSIQLPNDDSSLLDVHSDVWSGDSPFEIVVWLPLVDCFRTKSMYLLKPKYYDKFEKKFIKFAKKDSESIFKSINKNIDWIKINKGNVLIFNQTLPHGNRVNLEKETRWSLNCRFKSVFSPYGDKQIGEFFAPISLRKMSEIGMKYKLPKI